MGTIYGKVGRNIIKLRKNSGLTQEELAEKARMTTRSVRAIEAGKRNPTLKSLYKIALALKVKPAELIS